MTTPRESGAQILSIEPLCTGETTAHKECLQVPDGDVATFKVKLSVNYQDCITTGDDGRCIPQAADEPYNFVLRMSNPYDCRDDNCVETDSAPIVGAAPGSEDAATCDGKSGKNGDLVVLVDGVVMGKEFIRFPRLPLGESEFLLQLARGPEYYNYKDISLSLASECEFLLFNDLCIMEQPDLTDTTTPSFFQKDTEQVSRDWCGQAISEEYLLTAAWETPEQEASRAASEVAAQLAAEGSLHEGGVADNTASGLNLQEQASLPASSITLGSDIGPMHIAGALVGLAVVQFGGTMIAMQFNSRRSESASSNGELRSLNRDIL